MESPGAGGRSGDPPAAGRARFGGNPGHRSCRETVGGLSGVRLTHGVVRNLGAVVLVHDGIRGRLGPQELRALLAHEICGMRRTVSICA